MNSDASGADSVKWLCYGLNALGSIPQQKQWGDFMPSQIFLESLWYTHNFQSHGYLSPLIGVKTEDARRLPLTTV